MTDLSTKLTGKLGGLTAALTSLAIVLSPVQVLAQAGSPPDEAEDSEDPDDASMREAKRLFDAGVTRYTAANYAEAVQLWLAAYDLIPATFDNRLIKAELIYNVARAQQKWFDIDQDVQHLRQSRQILARYLGEVDELYGEQAELEREKIQEQIDEVDEQIAAWEAEQARHEAELAERMRPKFDEQADAREAKRNKAMLGAGAGLSALGFGGVGLLVTGVILANAAQSSTAELPLEADIPTREAAIARGHAGNALLVTGSLAAGVFLAAGLPLLAVGATAEKQRKQRRAEAGLDLASVRVQAITPLWLRGGAGLSVGGVF